MMKKMLCAILAVLTAASMFTGCGGAGSTSSAAGKHVPVRVGRFR